MDFYIQRRKANPILRNILYFSKYSIEGSCEQAGGIDKKQTSLSCTSKTPNDLLSMQVLHVNII